MLNQNALGLVPRTAAETRQAPLEILVQIALDGAPGDISVSCDQVVGQIVALEPKDLDLALDTRVRVIVPVVSQSTPVVPRKNDRPHDRSTRC